MIAINHPELGAALTQDPLARGSVFPIYRIVSPAPPPSPIRSVTTPAPSVPVSEPTAISPVSVPPNQISPPVESGTGGGSVSTVETSSGQLPIQVSSIVDPETGVTYAGYLTSDAQALYQSGSLLMNGNQLTPQGSALAAQGDLIQGTPAPTAAQISQAQASTQAMAQPAAIDASTWMNWLSEETILTGYPNGAVAALGVIALAWIFGGKKKRR